MTELLLAGFFLVCLGLIVFGLRMPGGEYQFPFLAGAVFLGYVFPQLLGLTQVNYLPHGGLDKTIIMASLSAGMCYLGYIWRSPAILWPRWRLDSSKLVWLSLVYAIGGAYFFHTISLLPEDMLQGQWSGISTVYAFFSKMMSLGLIVSLLIYWRTRSKLALTGVVFASYFFLEAIVFMGRRAYTLQFFFYIVLSLWFVKDIRLPKWVMVAAILVGSLLFNSAGSYRGAVIAEDKSPLAALITINFAGNLLELVKNGGFELTNAVFNVSAADIGGSFDYGASNWNQLVFAFVPAQFLGADFKSSLMVDLKDPAETVYGYYPHPGSTPTGLTDAFQSFWYFGAFKFFLIAYIMRGLYAGALAGSFSARIFYMYLVVFSMHSVTHSTQWFFNGWIFAIAFLVPGLYFSRIGKQRACCVKHNELTSITVGNLRD